MNVKDFVLRVKMMREAQKNYFATRSREWLTESKRLEKEVDNVLLEIAKMFQ
jgi:hypothetical protein